MQNAAAKRTGTPPTEEFHPEKKRARFWSSGASNSISNESISPNALIPEPSAASLNWATSGNTCARSPKIVSRAASAPPQTFKRNLIEESTRVDHSYRVSPGLFAKSSPVKVTVPAEQAEDPIELPACKLERHCSTKESRIKIENSAIEYQFQAPSTLITAEVPQERARVLAQKIHSLIKRRKAHHDNAEALKKRIRQSQLTYADLIRKRNKLETSLADLKMKLDADERLLETETRSEDTIPTELEQVSAELAALITN